MALGVVQWKRGLPWLAVGRFPHRASPLTIEGAIGTSICCMACIGKGQYLELTNTNCARHHQIGPFQWPRKKDSDETVSKMSQVLWRVHRWNSKSTRGAIVSASQLLLPGTC